MRYALVSWLFVAFLLSCESRSNTESSSRLLEAEGVPVRIKDVTGGPTLSLSGGGGPGLDFPGYKEYEGSNTLKAKFRVEVTRRVPKGKTIAAVASCVVGNVTQGFTHSIVVENSSGDLVNVDQMSAGDEGQSTAFSASLVPAAGRAHLCQFDMLYVDSTRVEDGTAASAGVLLGAICIDEKGVRTTACPADAFPEPVAEASRYSLSTPVAAWSESGLVWWLWATRHGAIPEAATIHWQVQCDGEDNPSSSQFGARSENLILVPPGRSLLLSATMRVDTFDRATTRCSLRFGMATRTSLPDTWDARYCFGPEGTQAGDCEPGAGAQPSP